MRLAKGKELEDWQEFCYVDIPKYETPWRIRAKVAELQQAGSCDGSMLSRGLPTARLRSCSLGCVARVQK